LHRTTLRRANRPKAGRLPHNGFVLEARVGTMGCVATVCKRHGTDPGVRADGFIGGNIKGFVEIGLGGGWGKLGSSGAGNNVLALYGIDPALLQQAVMEEMNVEDLDLSILEVESSSATAVQVGPALRIHFVPRGRILAFVGTGVSYNRFRAQYVTNTGNARFDFHGMAVPVTAGLGVMVAKNLSVGAQLDYLWTRYWLAVLEHPLRRTLITIGQLEEAAQMKSDQLQDELPRFWTVTVVLRTRF